MATIETKSRLIFEDDLLVLGEDVNAEVIDGELVIMPAAKPDHGLYGSRVNTFFTVYLSIHPVGRAFSDQTAYITKLGPRGSIKDSLVPDVSYVSFERLPADTPLDVMLRIAPDIAIEIISDSEKPDDIFSKTQRYLAFGVRQVWLLFHVDHKIRVCTPDQPLGTVYGMDDILTAGDVLPGFAVPVRAIYDLHDNALLAETIRTLMEPT